MIFIDKSTFIIAWLLLVFVYIFTEKVSNFLSFLSLFEVEALKVFQPRNYIKLNEKWMQLSY